MEERRSGPIADAWHAAERRLATRDPDAADFEEMTLAVEQLRLEYQRLSAGNPTLGDRASAAVPNSN